MALAERPTVTAEEKEARLDRLRAMYPEPREPQPDRAWHSLGIELEDVPETPVVDTGMAALRHLCELLDRRRTGMATRRPLHRVRRHCDVVPDPW